MVVLEDRVQRPRAEAVEARLGAPGALEGLEVGRVGQRGRVHQREVGSLAELRAQRVGGVAEQHQRPVVPGRERDLAVGRGHQLVERADPAGDRLRHGSERQQVRRGRRRSPPSGRPRCGPSEPTRRATPRSIRWAGSRPSAARRRSTGPGSRRTCRRGPGRRPTARPSGARGCGRARAGSGASSSARRRRRPAGRRARRSRRRRRRASPPWRRTTSTPGMSTAPAARAAPHSAANSAPRCTPRPCRALPQARVGEVHEAPAVDRRPDDVVDPGRAGADLLEHAEALEHGDPGRLQQQPGAHRARVRRAFEDLDRVPGAREQRRRGQARGPRPDDADPPHEAPIR